MMTAHNTATFLLGADCWGELTYDEQPAWIREATNEEIEAVKAENPGIRAIDSMNRPYWWVTVQTDIAPVEFADLAESAIRIKSIG